MRTVEVSDAAYRAISVASGLMGVPEFVVVDRLVAQFDSLANVDVKHEESGGKAEPKGQRKAQDNPQPKDQPKQTTNAGRGSDSIPSTLISVRAIYRGVEARGVFDADREGIRVLVPEAAAFDWRAPSQAAGDVVEAVNPERSASNTNGWRFWRIEASDMPLESIRARPPRQRTPRQEEDGTMLRSQKDILRATIANRWSAHQQFSLDAVYKHGVPALQPYSSSKDLRPAIRRYLQEFRDEGFLEFLDDNGQYRRRVEDRR